MTALDELIARDAGGVKSSPLDALLARDGATPAPTAATPKPAAKPTDNGLIGQIGHQLGLTGRAGVTALTALPNMAGDALNGAIKGGGYTLLDDAPAAPAFSLKGEGYDKAMNWFARQR